MTEETISKGEPMPAHIQVEKCLQELIEGKAIKYESGNFLKD